GGKTTLVEALLVASGVLTRQGSVVDGTTVCDSDDAEIAQQRSVGPALAWLEHDGIKVNLIDTPGYADFVGELRAGLRAADCALFVIASNEPGDPMTAMLWRECGDVRAGPRAGACALFVIASNEPVDQMTAMLWRECADVGMPRAVVVTKLDHARADYPGVLAAAQEAVGRNGD